MTRGINTHSLSSALSQEEEEDTELFISNFFKHHPQGRMCTELAEDQKHCTNIYTNGLLSSGRNTRSEKEVSSVTLIAHSQVKYIYLSN